MPHLPQDEHWLDVAFPFKIYGEELLIPYRIYRPIPDVTHLAREEQQIIACMYTRHHDGFVREEQLRRAFELHDGWMVPYVIQLLGEYVTPIHQVMLTHLAVLQSEAYRKAYKENPDFVERTKRRIISYWTCYYRRTALTDYPAFQVAEALGWWEASDVPHLRRRANQ